MLSYTVTYKDADGNDKTITATRDLDTNKWSGPGVNENTGVITLKVEDIKVGGTITAIAKDNGGLEGDTNKLDSDPAMKKLETATVSYDANKGTGKMDGKKLNKGSKYKILDNKFKAPENQEFDTWEIDGKKVAADTEITLTKDTVVKAIWKDKPASSSTTPGKDKPGKQGESQPQNPAAGGNLSKTGANGMYSLYASLLLLATGGLFLISRRRRAQR